MQSRQGCHFAGFSKVLYIAFPTPPLSRSLGEAGGCCLLLPFIRGTQSRNCDLDLQRLWCWPLDGEAGESQLNQPGWPLYLLSKQNRLQPSHLLKQACYFVYSQRVFIESFVNMRKKTSQKCLALTRSVGSPRTTKWRHLGLGISELFLGPSGGQ